MLLHRMVAPQMLLFAEFAGVLAVVLVVLAVVFFDFLVVVVIFGFELPRAQIALEIVFPLYTVISEQLESAST